jgi:23S rRNA (adenine1618-N6)-methyltransferase
MKAKTITERRIYTKNLDKFGYDFEQLIIKSPELKLLSL